ncbi:mig-6 [Cordylochernes scorpioides]|uniref:Mig-6 n=1 Tax=Cordylochernes scorpioides TaxID=51811 RepID=A0ABY6LRV3_9ARAC|nr:mig-6 [Cordylochernes scorpioides]
MVVVTAESYEPFCELDSETGPCRAYFVRYFYDKELSRCRKFVYGGCRGNANNFNTKEECAEICGGAANGETEPEDNVIPILNREKRQTNPICQLPAIVGRCRGGFPRYYFGDGRCQLFTYGGCDGNANNFNTIEECEAACGESS